MFKLSWMLKYSKERIKKEKKEKTPKSFPPSTHYFQNWEQLNLKRLVIVENY